MNGCALRKLSRCLANSLIERIFWNGGWRYAMLTTWFSPNTFKPGAMSTRRTAFRERKVRMARCSVLRIGSAFVLVMLAAAVQAQPVKNIRSTSTTPCSGCRLQIDSVFSLGTDDVVDTYYFERNVNTVALTGAGQLIVTGNALPMVFDLQGRFLRKFGHKGRGPGEFPLPPTHFWVAANDDLHFFIAPYQLVVVYRPDGTYVRQYRLSQSAKQPRPLPDGRIVAQHPSGQFRGNEVHDNAVLRVFAPSGELQREIGRGTTMGDRGMFVGVDGTIWTWKLFPYSLRQWAADGQLLSTFDRVIPTFGTGSIIVSDRSYYVQPRILSARQDPDDGFLWVTYVDGPPRKNCEGPVEACWDTKVEVLDLKTGALIASAKVPVSLSKNIGKGYYASYRVSSGRGAAVVIYLAKLMRPAQR